jgi:hypothetical protein
MRTRVPYRTILAAASRGELAALRPSGTGHGCILISESAWVQWTEGVRVRVRVSGRVGPRPPGRGRSLDDLALT